MSRPKLLDHEHGVANQHCKHPECHRAYTRYIKRWRYDREHGRLRLGDPTAAREHIAVLKLNGWSQNSIAATAGMSASGLSHIANGDHPTARQSLLDRILAIDPGELATVTGNNGTEPFVRRTGTVRRIKALLALGWTHEHMRAQFGIRTAVTLNQAGEWITRSKHDAVVAMYDALSMTLGPSAATRARAAKKGYAPPLAWDDAELDNPQAEPYAADKRPPGRPSERAEDIAWLRSQGESDAAIAARFGITLDAIQTAVRRAS